MCRTAFRNVSVFDVFPSPTPPNSVIDITTFLIGTAPKNPAQVFGSSATSPGPVDLDINHAGKTGLFENWTTDRIARSANNRIRGAHEDLITLPVSTPQNGFAGFIFRMHHQNCRIQQKNRLLVVNGTLLVCKGEVVKVEMEEGDQGAVRIARGTVLYCGVGF
jgi:hypothetical protein